MRIGIDARLAGSEHAGIGRYIEELLRGLVELPTTHHWVVFLRHENQLPWLVPSKYPNVEKRIVNARHYTLREQLLAPIIFYRARIDLLHVPHFNIPVFYFGKILVTIHDLLWHEIRDHRATTLTPWMHMVKYEMYRFVTKLAIQRAKVVVCPTKVVRQKIWQLQPQAAVQVVPEGISVLPTTTAKKASFLLPTHFLCYIGSLYPHKNVARVLELLRLEPKLELVLCSSRSVFTEQVLVRANQLRVARRVHFLGYVPDGELGAVMRASVAVIQPSLSEGFGLTGVEALGSGTPLLASDIPVFREVYGDLAVYFDPKSTESLQQAYQYLLENRSILIKKIRAKQDWLYARYDWKKMANAYLQLYQSCEI